MYIFVMNLLNPLPRFLLLNIFEIEEMNVYGFIVRIFFMTYISGYNLQERMF